MQNPILVTLESAITATNIPTAVQIDDVDKCTLVITSAGTFNARSGVATVTVSYDGTNYVSYNMLIPNLTNTNGQMLTRVASTTAINTTGQMAVYQMVDMMPVKFIKVLLTITDGGSPTGNFTVQLYKHYQEM